MIATIVKTMSWPHGIANFTLNCDSAFVTSTARKIPSGSPSAAPMSDVMTLSCRIMAGAKAVGMTTVQALWFAADADERGVDPDYEAFTPMDVLNVVRRLTGET